MPDTDKYKALGLPLGMGFIVYPTKLVLRRSLYNN